MSIFIPFDPDLFIGHTVDMRKGPHWSLGKNFSFGTDVEQVNAIESHFSVVKTLSDVSHILDIPPEYVLKVAVDSIPNDLVKSCLDNLGNKGRFTIVFRTTFVQQNLGPNGFCIGQRTDMTHIVSGMKQGSELVVMVTFKTEDCENLEDISESFAKKLKSNHGQLNDEVMNYLAKFAKKWDKHLSRSYKNVEHRILYFSYTKLGEYPATLEGMATAIEDFRQRCEITSNSGTKLDVGNETMSYMIGSGPSQGSSAETGGFSKINSFKICLSPRTEESHEDLASGFAKLSLDQEVAETILQKLQSVGEATGEIKKLKETYCADCKKLEGLAGITERNVYSSHETLVGIVNGLDMINPLSSVEILKELESVNIWNEVERFKADVTTLPKGPQLDLLILGKTGHGKSATCNSILKMDCFESSPSSQSETTESKTARNEIDKRWLNVTDTPGTFDTKATNSKEAEKIVKKAFCEAFLECPNGFHAFPLVLKFGTRMTPEERKAIEMMKKALGEDIIKNHCVFVITHADNFETYSRSHGDITFLDWCCQETGFLKDMIVEAGYRCIPFNNVTDDPKKKHAQLVKLINLIEDFGGKRHTGSLVKIVQDARRQVFKEMKTNEVDDDLMLDIDDLLGSVNKVKQMNGQDKLDGLRNLSKMVASIKHKKNVASVFPQLSQSLDHLSTAIQDNTMDKLDSCTQIMKIVRDDEVALFFQNLKKKVRPIVEKKMEECFPGNATVVLKTGITKMMADLNVGDEVLARNKNGQLGFDKVYMFGHSDLDRWATFVVLETESSCVSVTEGHYVFCVRDGVEMCLPAGTIRCEDKLLTTGGDSVGGSRLGLEPITKVSYQSKRGLFAPFTMSGSIVVDGSLTSCYVDVLSPSMSHFLLWPVRQMSYICPQALQFTNGDPRHTAMPGWIKMVLRWL